MERSGEQVRIPQQQENNDKGGERAGKRGVKSERMNRYPIMHCHHSCDKNIKKQKKTVMFRVCLE